MELKGVRVLVLGGTGMVGQAVCRELLRMDPSLVVVGSIDEASARQVAEQLRREFPEHTGAIVPEWGNVFVPESMKDRPWQEILADPRCRRMLLEDVLGEFAGERKQAILQRSTLAQVIRRHRPDVIVDCVNTATAVAYQNIYEAADRLLDFDGDAQALREQVERLLVRLYVPQLVRHVQILYETMRPDPAAGWAGVKAYVKVGTTGTGGMGLTIPFTHGEEQPSRMLLAKSAIAGAHTMLLFLMARSPGAPVVKEIKPAAAIAWKAIGWGPVVQRGQVLGRYDCLPEEAYPVAEAATPGTDARFGRPCPGALESVWVDMGEDGLLAALEFEALTALDSMELITADEVAAAVVAELRGANTGMDVVGALDAAVAGPTYRGGILREVALEYLASMQAARGLESTAFGMLGPRTSKLLFEARLLEVAYERVSQVLAADPAEMGWRLLQALREHEPIRVAALSTGIPVLLPAGDRIMRGPTVKVGRPEDGWIDLRPENMARWKRRLAAVREQALQEVALDPALSSRFERAFVNRPTGEPAERIRPGRLVAWILCVEERGARQKR